MAVDALISDAWAEAARDLGIRVTAPFRLALENGEELWFEAHVADFGGPNGTVVGNKGNVLADVRKVKGFYASNVWPSYQAYSRELFVATLNDWGWFGEKGKQPSWYSGEPWS